MPLDRITSDPAILDGQACIRGSRLSVRRVLKLISLYPDRAELRTEFPELEDEDIQQALEFAALQLDDKVVDLREAS